MANIQKRVTSLEYLVALRSYFQINETSKALENFDQKRYYISCQYDLLDGLFGQNKLPYLEAKSDIQNCWKSEETLELVIAVKLSNRLLKRNIDQTTIQIENHMDYSIDSVLIFEKLHLPSRESMQATVDLQIQHKIQEYNFSS